jgi:AraC family ethanolamine operon transcriptional activator
MEFLEFASDLPLSATEVFRSAEETEERTRELGVDHCLRQLIRGPFRAALTGLSADQVTFAADRYSTASMFRLEAEPGTTCLVLPRSAGGPIHAHGIELDRSNLVLLPGGARIELVAPNLAGSDGLVVSTDRFMELLGVLCPGVHPPEEAVVLEGDRTSLDAIRANVLQMLAHPERMASKESVSNILVTAVNWVGERLPHREPRRTARSRKKVAEGARTFIETHYRDTVCMEDLCRATGACPRMVQRCFRWYFDLTITDYLNLVRFDTARRALACAHPAEQTVGRIAMDHGFGHLGRFSVEFKRRFGLSPRELLTDGRRASARATGIA